MSQSLWETEVAVETRSGNDEHGAPEEAGALTLSVDDFSALEDRIRCEGRDEVIHAQAIAGHGVSGQSLTDAFAIQPRSFHLAEFAFGLREDIARHSDAIQSF